jgi:V/A-type H+-transporting ATPase subunit I
MIIPMKKICLVVKDKSRDEALKKLRSVGVVHLEKRNMPVDNNSSAQIRKTKVEDAMGLIYGFKVPKKEKKPKEQDNVNSMIERRQKPVGLHRGRRAVDIYGTEEEAPYSIDAIRAPARPFLPDLIINIEKERKALQLRNVFLNVEITRIAPWGDFNPETVKGMASLGLPVFLYEISNDDYKKIGDDVRCIKLKSDKTAVRLVILDKEIQGIIPFQLPEKPMSALIKEEEENKIKLEELTAKLKNFANRHQALEKEMTLAEQDIEFEDALASLVKIEDIPSDNLNYSLSWITGYVPIDDFNCVKNVARENGWGLSAGDPAKNDEAVPTKLKNNKFVNLLNPITSFLEILPGYEEVDISPFFLMFFCIYFSMIFGDGGYGAILFITAFLIVVKSLMQKKGVSQGVLLLLLLGFFNTVWGVLTCTWFGVEVQKAPQFLQDLSLPFLSTAKTSPDIVTQNLQIFCFSLALIHLTVAHLINFVRYIKTPKLFAELGSIAILAGMYNVVLYLIVSNEIRRFPLFPVSIYMIGGGFLMILLFGAYEGSVKQSILSGVKGIISVFLGVISIFSDIMSYIRLWAVGLAGASIAETINTLAGPMLGSFLVFAGIILLILGHGLNMVLNVLSVLVHGVRLNTLEFSGHVNLSWSGKPYKPFAEKVVNKN